MLEEAVVFGGDERLAHDQRDLFVLHRVAALLADLRDQIAAERVYTRSGTASSLFFIAATDRQRRFEVDIAADEGVCDRKCDHRHTHQQLHGESKVVWLHRIRVSIDCAQVMPYA